MRRVDGIAGLRSLRGEEVGVSDWQLVDQAQIDRFAAATGDDYWLHTDPERAAGSSFGSTIAHGLLTLSLGPSLTYQVLEVSGFAANLNYGYGKVRFLAPVPVGSRVRLRLTLVELRVDDLGVRCDFEQVFELEGSERPACVAESILYWTSE